MAFRSPLFFLVPFNISFKGSFPLRRLSFDRDAFVSLGSSCPRDSLGLPAKDVDLSLISAPENPPLVGRPEPESVQAAAARPEENPTIFGIDRHMKAEPATRMVARVVARMRRGSFWRAAWMSSVSSLPMVREICLRDDRGGSVMLMVRTPMPDFDLITKSYTAC